MVKGLEDVLIAINRSCTDTLIVVGQELPTTSYIRVAPEWPAERFMSKGKKHKRGRPKGPRPLIKDRGEA